MIANVARPVAFTAGAAAATGPGYLAGWAIRETAGAAFVVRLWDNATAASGLLLASIAVPAAGAGPGVMSLSPSVAFMLGVWMEKVSGTTIDGAVYIQ